MHVRARSSWLIVVALCGCAGARPVVIDGKLQPRSSFGYTDHALFAVQLRDAYPAPRGPSAGTHSLAARLGGSVCGTDIAYDATFLGKFMTVTGFATNIHSRGDQMSLVITNTTSGATEWVSGPGDSRSVSLEVRDVVAHDSIGERQIRGSIGEPGGMVDPLAIRLARNPPSHAVDLHLTTESLTGAIGIRTISLRRSEDDLIGFVEIYGTRMPFVLRGVGELWSMPAAAQAAILPLVLTCTSETKLVQRVDFRNES